MEYYDFDEIGEEGEYLLSKKKENDKVISEWSESEFPQIDIYDSKECLMATQNGYRIRLFGGNIKKVEKYVKFFRDYRYRKHKFVLTEESDEKKGLFFVDHVNNSHRLELKKPINAKKINGKYLIRLIRQLLRTIYIFNRFNQQKYTSLFECLMIHVTDTLTSSEDFDTWSKVLSLVKEEMWEMFVVPV